MEFRLGWLDTRTSSETMTGFLAHTIQWDWYIYLYIYLPSKSTKGIENLQLGYEGCNVITWFITWFMRKAKRCELFFRKIWRSPVHYRFPWKGLQKHVISWRAVEICLVSVSWFMMVGVYCLYRYLGLYNHSHTIHGMIIYLPTWMTRSQRPLKW